MSRGDELTSALRATESLAAQLERHDRTCGSCQRFGQGYAVRCRPGYGLAKALEDAQSALRRLLQPV